MKCLLSVVGTTITFLAAVFLQNNVLDIEQDTLLMAYGAVVLSVCKIINPVLYFVFEALTQHQVNNK